MALINKVTIVSDDKDQFRITWKDEATGIEDWFIQDNPRMNGEVLDKLQVHTSYGLELGEILFHFLDGPSGYLTKALLKASEYDEPLILHLVDCKEISHWPFELLAKDGNYLLPYHLHLIHRLSDRAQEKKNKIENRPLKVLFMACSPLDGPQELDFEKEEETFFQITKDLPMDIEVEDLGTLEGLRRRLAHKKYDLIHLSGHIDMDDQGQPFFIMEDEVGFRQNVSPAQLYKEALIEESPRVLFLAGFQRGIKKNSEAAMLFARVLVEKNHVHTVLTWRHLVRDEQARLATEKIYWQLCRGESILNSVKRARYELIENWQSDTDRPWSSLCLYNTGHDLGSIVEQGQKQNFLTGGFIIGSETFVGRRRQLQLSLKILKNSNNKVGLLLYGATGLGKSVLAKKICDRLKEYTLIKVQGKFDASNLSAALRDGFIKTQDKKGLEILSQEGEMADKLANLCATSFKERNYLLIFDDFEHNMESLEKCHFVSLISETVDLLRNLLYYLPLSGKMTQLIITSRYVFSITKEGQDLIEKHLQKICLPHFNEVELQKKARELKNYNIFREPIFRNYFLGMSGGNPRLMERFDQMLGQMDTTDVQQLSEAITNEREKFIYENSIRLLLQLGGQQLIFLLAHISIYRLPVFEVGIQRVAEKTGISNWKELLKEGTRLSLVEFEQIRQCYQVTPLLREELLKGEVAFPACHEAAFEYYRMECENCDSIAPDYTEEWIYHALGCGKEDIASEQAEKLVGYYMERLDYLESQRIGEWVLSLKKNILSTTNDAHLLNQLAKTLMALGEHWKAIGYFQTSLKILETIWGRQDPKVAEVLNNLGAIFIENKDHRNALECFQQAIDIWKNIYGDNYPQLSICLNNIGSVWMETGDYRKALEHYKQALILTIKIHGKNHDQTASCLNNMGAACIRLEEKEEIALFYSKRALAIWKAVHGENHPQTAAGFHLLGQTWLTLGHYQKALDYFRQALKITSNFYGEMHPQFAKGLSDIGVPLSYLDQQQEAIHHYQQALEIFKNFYGETHPFVATTLGNLGSVCFEQNQHQEAIDYLKQALAIDEGVYGKDHPNVGSRLIRLGKVFSSLGNKTEAKFFFQKAYKIYQKFFGDLHPKTQNAKDWLHDC